MKNFPIFFLTTCTKRKFQVANEFWLEKTQSVFAQTANTGFSIRQPELVGVLRACTNQPVYGLFEIDRQIDALLAPMIDEAKQEIAEFKLGDLTRLLDDADRKLRPVETQIKAAKDKMVGSSKPFSAWPTRTDATVFALL